MRAGCADLRRTQRSQRAYPAPTAADAAHTQAVESCSGVYRGAGTASGRAASGRRPRALSCAGRIPLETRLELAQHIDRPRTRPVVAATQEAVPHAVDGTGVELLALVTYRPQLRLARPHPACHGKVNPILRRSHTPRGIRPSR